MTDFETLGAFYLGKEFDVPSRKRSENFLLYDSKDLTTHAVIIGMTGSGKTGLGISMIEEALIDRIPVIAIDPKGDLGNLALQFPGLSAREFRPWVDPQQAANAGSNVEAYAEAQATFWRDGMAQWGEDGARVQRLRDAADVTIYTPGSTAGKPLSILQAFPAPSAAEREDSESFRDRVDATATSVLAFLGVEGDPMSSREHILLANLLSASWSEGRDLDLAGMIAAIQSPPFSTIGVMPLDSVFPPKDRLALAMKLNNLLAAPGFQVWMQGEPLRTANLLYTDTGKPRCAVVSIAHLNDQERMFFVTMLLADILAWIRTQPGTGSLRAILYIDELFGYMPPVSNPSSKILLLTLLKQARAFGLGVVLSTQNPVDLDYKGLSNTGTWFIGRMQTERDKARVMEGLEGASNGAAFDRDAMEKTIAGLGKRVFLMHSVHENAPVTFETRWTLSYLAGPMTREQIKLVTASSAARVSSVATDKSSTAGVADAATRSTSGGGMTSLDATPAKHAPVLPPDVPQYFIPPDGSPANITYHPAIIGVADITYASAKYNVTAQRRVVLLATLDDGPIAMDWGTGERVDIDPGVLESGPWNGATFGEVPKLASSPKSYPVWAKALQKWVATNEVVTLYRSPSTKQNSGVDENERDFRIRLQVSSREKRDIVVEKLRGKYATKLSALQERIRKAEQAVAREQSEASQAKMDTMISVGSAVLGAIFGRGKVGVGTISKVGTAARGAGRAARQGGDVTRAGETVQALSVQYEELQGALQGEIDELGAAFDAQSEQLEEIVIKAKAGDVTVPLVALAWTPV
ncbi:MAG: ATP-binding protein [Phycisphaerae bacterium]|nr:ATP-binding protein [Gemmatimonadaceae bacterium]